MTKTENAEFINVALAGLGTVGAGVYKILNDNAELITRRTGKKIKVVAVSARDKTKDRGIDLSSVDWVDNPMDLVSRKDVDVVVEMIGGSEDPALGVVKSALENGKAVVTANKALMAYHGFDLAEYAEKNDLPLLYEASVAGGIPIIKVLREGLAANNIKGLYGILNGTCNYILTAMEETGRAFDDILKEAQEQGYAEADPTLDIGGGDTGHKLVLLTSLAFQRKPGFENLQLEGIEHITVDDIKVAAEFGCRIKLVGQSIKQDNGHVLQMVGPCLVPRSSPLARVRDVLNGVLIKGDFVGPSFIEGRGAGEGPTASAIVADLIDLARCGGAKALPILGYPTETLGRVPKATRDDWNGRFFIRFMVNDRPGVIAEIAPIFRDHQISIESLIQRSRSTDQPVPIIIATHETSGRNMYMVAKHLSLLDSVIEPPLVLPILDI